MHIKNAIIISSRSSSSIYKQVEEERHMHMQNANQVEGMEGKRELMNTIARTQAPLSGAQAKAGQQCIRQWASFREFGQGKQRPR